MQDSAHTLLALGNEPPLVADGRSGPPDRREVSARWLSGTFLTGITSTILMGVALMAALDGREQLAQPPEVARATGPAQTDIAGEAAKAARLVPARTIAAAKDRRRMEVSTMSRVGDREVVRTQPFVHVDMALAAGHSTSRNYPSFDPLAVFAEDPKVRTANTGIIYGAKVESEVSLRTLDFPFQTATFDEASALSADEVERVVRTTAAILTEGTVQVAALHYVDPQRFGETLATATFGQTFARIVPENVSVARPSSASGLIREYLEDVIAVGEEASLRDVLAEAGHVGSDAEGMATAISRLLDSELVAEGSVLRLGIESFAGAPRIMRASLYLQRAHLMTVALNDRSQYVPADEPEPSPAVAAAFEEDSPDLVASSDLPNVYDGVYRAALSYGLSTDLTQQLVRLLASDVDFQSRLRPSDRLEVFFSEPDEDDRATERSEILYFSASFGDTTRNFYRFQMEDGTVDYFDEDGRSARQFLLRNPVPNGRFTSGFGSRRHPILGYSRMHAGVDWAAPRGTPIIASGHGTVVEAGWSSGGYGRHTVIRHANGYVTSYSHQHAIAEGIVPGARVRQGQVIGYVGSTGLSTGNHLHYELSVNGSKVDPMRVRLPDSRTLEDEELVAFQSERERIDALLTQDEETPLSVASVRVSE
jgi:murein DD-endopeptidase MepM/ murein hydrolase activator NlpD